MSDMYNVDFDRLDLLKLGLLTYLTVEAVFGFVLYVVVFKIYYQNDQPPPAPYRDYKPGSRHQLMLRILKRLERTFETIAIGDVENCNTAETAASASVATTTTPTATIRRRKTGSSATTSQTMSSSSSHDSDDTVSAYIMRYLNLWFHEVSVESTTSDNNQRDETTNDDRSDDQHAPSKEEMDSFFAWAFFGMDVTDLEDWMIVELRLMYDLLKKGYGIQFQPNSKRKGRKIQKQPMRLSIDPLKPTYRPLILYALFAVIHTIATITLRVAGFSHHTTTPGLSYWYRPAKKQRRERQRQQQQAVNPLPILFFHGIAPGGLGLYLPFLLWGIGTSTTNSTATTDSQKDRNQKCTFGDEEKCNSGNDDNEMIITRPALFLFENPAISLSLTGRAPTENETTSGAWEAVETQLGGGNRVEECGVSVMGHSFGSCPVTWMIHSEYAHRIKQIILLDPVSVLLSEPDVVGNFVYGGLKIGTDDIIIPPSAPSKTKTTSYISLLNSSTNGSNNNTTTVAPPKKKKSGTGLVSNEFFLEYYLRRNFYWYNCELWLEDIPPTCRHVIIGVAEDDNVLNGRNVKQEVDIFFQSHSHIYDFTSTNETTPILSSGPIPGRQETSLSASSSITGSSSSVCRSASCSSSSLSPCSSKANGASADLASSSISSDSTITTPANTAAKKAKSDLIYWQDKGHGFCVANKEVWAQIKGLMQKHS